MPHREYPSFSGTLTPELVFFGFGVPPSAGTDHWLVLEEPPPGLPLPSSAARGRVAADGLDVRGERRFDASRATSSCGNLL